MGRRIRATACGSAQSDIFWRMIYPMIRLRHSIAFASFLASSYAQAPVVRHPANGTVQVSGMSPFATGCAGTQTGVVYPNSTVEPFVAVDPTQPAHLVGVWQQDRWNNGGANGVLAAVSMNDGRTWTTSSPHFSLCTGGVWERASDPWVSIAPDGTAHFAALGVNAAGALTSVLVSRSSDGGLTWSEPVTLDANAGDDKDSITADPTDSRFVYTIWDNANGGHNVPAWFSRSTDGGLNWERPRVIYDPGAFGYADFHQIVVTPDSTLVDVFSLGFQPQSGRTSGTWIAVLRSLDHGATWSAPILVSTNQWIAVVDAKTQQGLRTGAGIASASVDPVSGVIDIVWVDSRFSGGLRDGVAFSKSMDGGLTWSDPVQVNQVPAVQVFTPVVAAGAGGRVAVSYYDFRQDTNDPQVLLTNAWCVSSNDGGTSWAETPVAGPFDLLSTIQPDNEPFLGDYQGLVASGERFISFFTMANSGNANNPSGLFASPADRPGDTRWTSGRTEINLHPQPMRHKEKPDPKLANSRNLKH
jgi:hypothetical protein